jgi:hypothetical protein
MDDERGSKIGSINMNSNVMYFSVLKLDQSKFGIWNVDRILNQVYMRLFNVNFSQYEFVVYCPS